MKNLIIILTSLIFVVPAQASCEQSYKSASNVNTVRVRSTFLVGIGATIRLQKIYAVHSSKKMRELIMEAKKGRAGKRINELRKALNNQKSTKDLISRVKLDNEYKILCQAGLLLWRDYRDALRAGIDFKRVFKKRQRPIWNGFLNDPKARAAAKKEVDKFDKAVEGRINGTNGKFANMADKTLKARKGTSSRKPNMKKFANKFKSFKRRR